MSRGEVRGSQISKIGDAQVWVALLDATHVMLASAVKVSARYRSLALAFVKRAGLIKAKVAPARKLAVVLHKMMGRRPSDMKGHRTSDAMAVA
jgi:hypothetical protein